jgi:hypothetical protein
MSFVSSARRQPTWLSRFAVVQGRQLRRIMNSTIQFVEVLEAWAFGATKTETGSRPAFIGR